MDGPEKLKPEHWKGCGILMDIELTLGITRAVNHAASAIQAVRNVTARGILGLAMAAKLDPTPVMAQIVEADRDTNNNNNSLMLMDGGKQK